MLLSFLVGTGKNTELPAAPQERRDYYRVDAKKTKE